MNKIKLGTTLTLATVALGLAVPLMAQADSNYDGTATAGFTPDTGTTDPLYPEAPDPSNPNVEVPGTGDAGPLSLDYVPTLDFGTNNIQSGKQIYHAKGVKGLVSGVEETQPHFVQVTDNRGTKEGWNVTAHATPFTTTATDTTTVAFPELPNSYVTFGKTAVAVPTGSVKADQVNTSGDDSGVNLVHDWKDDGTGTMTGTETNLFGATADTTGAGNGLGTNLLVAGAAPADTTLTKATNDSVSETTYESVITYTLTATPATPY